MMPETLHSNQAPLFNLTAENLEQNPNQNSNEALRHRKHNTP